MQDRTGRIKSYHMKLTGLFALLLSGTLFIFWSNPGDCRKNFEGKWRYKTIPQDTIFVVRTFAEQREYTEGGKYYYAFKLRWINDCKYVMIYKGTTSNRPALIPVGDSLLVEILNINKTEMKYKTTVGELVDIGEMERMQ